MNKYLRAIRRSKPIKRNVAIIVRKMRDMGLSREWYRESDIVDAAMDLFEMEHAK